MSSAGLPACLRVLRWGLKNYKGALLPITYKTRAKAREGSLNINGSEVVRVQVTVAEKP